MARSKSFFGLRKGSTKTLTFQVMNGQQITKDRVVAVRNPQSRLQMIQRVSFATVGIAAEQFYSLIRMSFEGLSEQKAKQKFISENAKILSTLALNNDTFPAFSPKGNSQLIPNNYMISRGSLSIPDILVPKTVAGGNNGIVFGNLASTYIIASLTAGNDYTAADLWKACFGLEPGDQITVPQVYIEGIAQSEGGVDGEGQDHVTDLVRYATFGAPRLVLKSGVGNTITIESTTSLDSIVSCFESLVDDTKTNDALFNALIGTNLSKSFADDRLSLYYNNIPYNRILGIGNANALVSLGVILSRQDSSLKWHYSTCRMVTIGEELSDDTAPEDSPMYHGYKISNAINTYMNGSRRVSANFMQTGTSSDIVPPDFQ